MATTQAAGDGERPRKKLSKAQRISREKAVLMSEISAGKLTTTRSRVGFLLNHLRETRNSDKTLVLSYWRTFQPTVLGSGTLDDDTMLRLENATSICRARAKIQNEYGLFQADDEVVEFRQERRRSFEQTAVLDKPGRPLVGVYCDESGKNDDYVLVGSVWTLDAKRQTDLLVDLIKWKSDRSLTGEFHFNKMSRKGLENYKAFFLEALSRSDTLSFKAVAVRQNNIRRPIDEITMDLYYQLVMIGLRHEFSAGRLTAPRQVQAWKDMEEGIDALHLEKVRQELSTALPRHFDNQAELELFEAVDSKGNFYIQLADLFTGSLNRVLNAPGETPNHKDEFAKFVLDALSLVVEDDGTIVSANQDIAALHIIPS